jgi:benzodiazapine receptor
MLNFIISGKARAALIMFIIQLLLNWSWTPLFFGYHLLKASAIEIIVLTLAVYMTTVFFFRIDKLAGYLFIPYCIW